MVTARGQALFKKCFEVVEGSLFESQLFPLRKFKDKPNASLEEFWRVENDPKLKAAARVEAKKKFEAMEKPSEELVRRAARLIQEDKQRGYM